MVEWLLRMFLKVEIKILQISYIRDNPNPHLALGGAVLSFIEMNRGALAQLVERLHGMQEVSGSIPLCSTIFHYFESSEEW